MGESPQLVRKGIPSRYLAITGIALAFIGGLMFLNSLGSGGGYFATGLMFSGVVVVIGAVVRAIINAVSRP